MITLQTAVQDFLLHCRFEKNLSEKTLKAYRTDLLQLQSFLTSKDFSTEISHISKIQIREYLMSISHLKPKSVKRKIASAKALFNFLEFEDELALNPFRKMQIRIKEEKKLPRVMDIKEVTRIFSTAYFSKNKSTDPGSYSYFESLRNIVIIELLFATGARVSEIANLKTDAINLDNGNIRIKGKGNKERVIEIYNPETISTLKRYYKLYKAKIGNADNYFLVNRFQKRISDQSIRNIINKLAVKAKIAKHITPHMFRHSFATLLLEKDVDIKYIQTLLGHSSIMTTQIYTHVNRTKQRQILKTKHPRKDFFMIPEAS